ncbi:MAG: hypothetical protein HJJLKODD_01143 [Phycisphaerae bacterium]|nr:hypothetical protein [Phycisphaerae bacterium]
MKILVIRNEPPWPLHYGGRLHGYELCRRLAEHHQLLMVAQHPAEGSEGQLNYECRVARNDRLRDDTTDPAAEGFVADRWERYFGCSMWFARDVARVVQSWSPDVVLGMNYQSLSCLSRLVGVPTICDLVDDEVLHNWLELWSGKQLSRWQSLKGLLAAWRYENRHLHRVQRVVVTSQRDRRCCQRVTGHPQIDVVTNGVDCDYYQPGHTPVDERRIIFWGSLSFGPNISALLYFGNKVWPVIKRQIPDLCWTIIGRGEAPQLEAVRSWPDVELLGFVEDIRPWVATATVAIVPMISGAGVKNKVLEAWAMGKAVLCTPRAIGDLPGVHGENVWVGRNPAELTAGLMRLLSDTALRLRLGTNARQTAVECCSWEASARQLERICMEAVGESRGDAQPFKV